MKKTLLLLCSALSLVTPLLAQSGEPLQTPPPPANPYARWVERAAGAGQQRTSTTARVAARSSSYSWVASTSRWSAQATVTTYSYDAQGRVLSVFVADSASQRPSIRYAYNRTAAGLIIDYVQEEWNGTAWVNKERFANTFDSRNKVTAQTYQRWTGTAWENDKRLTVTFNARGEQESGIWHYWINGAWVLQGGMLNVAVYDSADRLIEYTSSMFDPATGQMELDQHVLYTYVGNSQLPNTVTVQTWDGSRWTNNHQEVLVSSDSQQRRVLTHHHTWDGTSWQLEYRASYTYSSTTASYVILQEVPQGTGWLNDSRSTYEYDSRNASTGVLTERWSNNSWRLIGGYVNRPTYNATDDIIIRLNQWAFRTGSGTAATYVMTNQNKTYYSNFQSYVLATRPRQVAAAGWQLAPNPTTGSVALVPAGGNTAALRAVQVLNGLGQVVWQQPLALLPTRAGTLDLGGLPTGVYTVQLLTAEGTLVRRLIKE